MTEIKPTEADLEAANRALGLPKDWKWEGGGSTRTQTYVAQAIATARMDERERCAVICESLREKYLKIEDNHAVTVLGKITKRIRSQS